jgi:hypothetical protein
MILKQFNWWICTWNNILTINCQIGGPCWWKYKQQRLLLHLKFYYKTIEFVFLWLIVWHIAWQISYWTVSDLLLAVGEFLAIFINLLANCFLHLVQWQTWYVKCNNIHVNLPAGPFFSRFWGSLPSLPSTFKIFRPWKKSSTIKSWPTFCDQYFWKFPIWYSLADKKRREIRMVKVNVIFNDIWLTPLQVNWVMVIN